MIDKGLDYSWGRPRVAEMKPAGYRFVLRYLSDLNDSSTHGKVITDDELFALRSAGIEVGLNWEYRVGDAKGGRPAGLAHANQACAQAEILGYPEGCTIYFSVDFDTDTSWEDEVEAYFIAVKEVLRRAGYRVGAYGEYSIIKFLFDKGLIDDGWQTYAWSGGKWDSRAAVRQVLNNQDFAGAKVDFNERHGATYLMGGTPMATQKLLPYSNYAQARPWSCGPAALKIALMTRGISVAEEVLIQKLGTTTAGTNSSSDIDRVYDEYIQPGVNNFEPIFVWGNDVTHTEAALFKQRLVASINAGYGVVVNVVGVGQDVNGARYTYSGGHYVAVVGYEQSGAVFVVADPAIGRTYRMTADRLDTWMAARGYVWAANVPTGEVNLPATDVKPGDPFPLPDGHYFGLKSGPAESHGGFYENERPYVKAIQRVVGATEDGDFGPATELKVKEWQLRNGLVADGKVGPLSWQVMFPKPLDPPPPSPPPVEEEPVEEEPVEEEPVEEEPVEEEPEEPPIQVPVDLGPLVSVVEQGFTALLTAMEAVPGATANEIFSRLRAALPAK